VRAAKNLKAENAMIEDIEGDEGKVSDCMQFILLHAGRSFSARSNSRRQQGGAKSFDCRLKSARGGVEMLVKSIAIHRRPKPCAYIRLGGLLAFHRQPYSSVFLW
jgi:hypothetical protein